MLSDVGNDLRGSLEGLALWQLEVLTVNFDNLPFGEVKRKPAVVFEAHRISVIQTLSQIALDCRYRLLISFR